MGRQSQIECMEKTFYMEYRRVRSGWELKGDIVLHTICVVMEMQSQGNCMKNPSYNPEIRYKLHKFQSGLYTTGDGYEKSRVLYQDYTSGAQKPVVRISHSEQKC